MGKEPVHVLKPLPGFLVNRIQTAMFPGNNGTARRGCGECRGYRQGRPPPTARDLVDEVRKYYPDARINFKPDANAVVGLRTIPRIIKGDAVAKEWGWRVTYSLEETVRDFIEEYKKTKG
jgi:nucleoside-diphosphate-sugar epimerase